jgi:hypothetical protein
MVYKMDVKTLFDASNVVFLIGTFLLIRAVIKNRVILKGFSPSGSLATFSAMMLVNVAYIIMGFWFSLVVASIITSYWLMAFLYSTKIFISNYREHQSWMHRIDRHYVDPCLNCDLFCGTCSYRGLSPEERMNKFYKLKGD